MFKSYFEQFSSLSSFSSSRDTCAPIKNCECVKDIYDDEIIVFGVLILRKLSDFCSRSVFIRFWWFLHKNVSQLKPEWSCFKFQVPIESLSCRKRRRQFRLEFWVKVLCYQSCFKSSIVLPSCSPWKELSKTCFAIFVGRLVKKF